MNILCGYYGYDESLSNYAIVESSQGSVNENDNNYGKIIIAYYLNNSNDTSNKIYIELSPNKIIINN